MTCSDMYPSRYECLGKEAQKIRHDVLTDVAEILATMLVETEHEHVNCNHSFTDGVRASLREVDSLVRENKTKDE